MRSATQDIADFVGDLAGTARPAARCAVHNSFYPVWLRLASSIVESESPSVSKARAALRHAIRCFLMPFYPSIKRCRSPATVQGQGIHGARRS